MVSFSLSVLKYLAADLQMLLHVTKCLCSLLNTNAKVYKFDMHLSVSSYFKLIFLMCSVSRESAEGGRVIVEVDDKVAKVRNIKVCFLSSSLFHVRMLIS